jgi:hypothetical protein
VKARWLELVLAVVKELPMARAPAAAEDLEALEPDVPAGFVLARAAAGLSGGTISSDVVHLEQVRVWFGRPLWEMEPADADAYFGKVLRATTNGTRLGRAQAIKTFFLFLDKRKVELCDHDPQLIAERPGLLIIADKGYVSAELDAFLAERGVRLLRPSYRNRTPRPEEHLLKPIRQLIESVNDTLKGQLDLELHGARTATGVGTRIGQRILALTAAIWHNDATGQTVLRSLIAYDH